MTSGYATVDAITGGMAMGQLTVIGARTDNGKTALCVGMALGQAKAGMAVGYIPIEDTRDEVTAKLTDAVAGFSLDWAEKVDPDHIDERLERWERHADAVGGLPVYVPGDGATPTDIDSLLGLVATMAVRSGCRVITIDHIDALPMTRSRGQSDASVVAEWMRSLKSLAVRLDVHLVVASQVSRAADEDGYLPPRMFRLKESGAKEQAAQTVIMVGLDGDVSEGRRVLHAYVEKVKGYPNGRHIDAGDGPALYLEVQSGAVRERGRRVELAPPAEQAAFIEEPAEVAP